MKPKILAYNREAMMMNDPGDYYRMKAELARSLLRAIDAVKQAQQLDYAAEAVYDRLIKVLEDRLEIARYVGD